MNRRHQVWIAIILGFAGCTYAWVRDPLQDLLQITVQTVADSDDTRDIQTLLVQESGDRLRGQSERLNSQRSRSSAAQSAFREVVGSSWKATVQVLSGNRQVSLGTIVDQNGWVITKASELPGKSLQCLLFDNSRAEAEVVAQRPELDLALLKLNRGSLPSVSWSSSSVAQVGSWLATTHLSQLPLAVGVISVGPRSIPAEPVVLGIEFDGVTDAAMVKQIRPGTGAERAGLQVGDVILEIDGDSLPSRDLVRNRILASKAGQRISLSVRRNDKKIEVLAQLMDIPKSLLDPTEMEVNGNVSARANGFASAFQHDTVIAPEQCGGPLIDLQGQVAGINIARAGRVSTYALPANVVIPAVQEMLAEAKVLAQNSPRASELIVRGQSDPLPIAKP